MNQQQIKSPKDSVVKKVLTFSSDEKLRESYLNPLGELRFGLILEELDSIAGRISYRHAVDPSVIKQIDKILETKQRLSFEEFRRYNLEIPLFIVTASCNRIELFGRLDINSDLVFDVV